MVRSEAVGYIARFQNGKPGTGGIMGDTGVVRETAQVEHLPDSSGTKPHKGLKNMEILDSRNLTDIPFDIGADVVAVPVNRIDVAVEQGGILSREEQVIERRNLDICCLQLGEGKGQEVEQRHSPSQRLRNPIKKTKVLGACEDEESRLLTFIHNPLDIGEKVGRPLDLVENSAPGKSSEKSSGVRQGKVQLVRVFQADVGFVWKNRARQRCFSRLARSGYGDDRIALRGLTES